MTGIAATRHGTSGRPFEKTHPWLRFALDMERAPVRLWLALGEARSKCVHLAGVPLKPDVAHQLHAVYLAKGVHATTAIEGNTLSERQVLERIQGRGNVVPESQEYLQIEIDNVIALSNQIIDEAEADGHVPITPAVVKDYNRRVLENLEVEEHVVPGECRKAIVGVMDYRAPAADDCEYLLERFCDWLNSDDFRPTRQDEAVVNGVVKAVVAHVYLAWIHPFGDGNGRTARALEVRFLMEAGVPSPAIHLLSNHYNKTRTEYYRRLQEASRNGGDLTNFMVYAVTGLVDQLREQLNTVRLQQWHVAWQNYVYEVYGPDKTSADKRQIELLMAMSEIDGFTPMNQLRRLTPSLAEQYAGKTPKTLTRDVNRLVEAGLAMRGPQGVRAFKEMILAFLPRMKKGGFEDFVKEGIWMKEGAKQFGSDALSLLDHEG